MLGKYKYNNKTNKCYLKCPKNFEYNYINEKDKSKCQIFQKDNFQNKNCESKYDLGDVYNNKILISKKVKITFNLKN